MAAPDEGDVPRPPARSLLAPLLLLLVSLAVAGLLAEALVVLVAGPQVRFPRQVVGAPWGVRYNRPGAVYRHRSGDGSWEFRINAQGMRDDRDHGYAKPPGTVRVVALGDSYTIGYEVAADETFAAVLERELNASGVPAEVLNAGVAGYSTAEAAVYLERELLRYDPDLVVLSFYANDLVDNVRTGLFALGPDGRAVPVAERYVPAGRVGDRLNRSALFNALSARSNAFSFLKERVTLLLKRSMVAANEANLARASARDSTAAGASPGGEGGEGVQRRLAAALVRRMADTLRARGVPLVVQSIPAEVADPTPRLVDAFPYEELGEVPGVHLLPARDVLAPALGRTALYRQRSHFHWTPFAHETSGRALAALIRAAGLLRRPAADGPADGSAGGTPLARTRAWPTTPAPSSLRD